MEFLLVEVGVNTRLEVGPLEEVEGARQLGVLVSVASPVVE